MDEREALVWYLKKERHLGKHIAVYGAGGIAEMSAESCFCPAEELEPRYFIDDTPEKHGMLFCGKPIINLEEATSLCENFQILLCLGSARVRNIIEQSLQERSIKGAEWFTLDEYIFARHAREVISVYDMLEDELSKQTYANMILTKMGKAEQCFIHADQYFGIPEFKTKQENEVFVDCGAYIGDTVEQYLEERGNMNQRIFAFEPYEKSFQALTDLVTQLKQKWQISDNRIELIQAGIGDKTGRITAKFQHEEMPDGFSFCGAANDENGTKVYAIDDYFSKQPTSFLKADIQGFEWNMLIGAEKTIKRDHPKLAICMYHTPCDMYRLALKIREFCPDYRFAVRQHGRDISDTVLYAY